MRLNVAHVGLITSPCHSPEAYMEIAQARVGALGRALHLKAARPGHWKPPGQGLGLRLSKTGTTYLMKTPGSAFSSMDAELGAHGAF